MPGLECIICLLRKAGEVGYEVRKESLGRRGRCLDTAPVLLAHFFNSRRQAGRLPLAPMIHNSATDSARCC